MEAARRRRLLRSQTSRRDRRHADSLRVTHRSSDETERNPASVRRANFADQERLSAALMLKRGKVGPRKLRPRSRSTLHEDMLRDQDWLIWPTGLMKNDRAAIEDASGWPHRQQPLARLIDAKEQTAALIHQASAEPRRRRLLIGRGGQLQRPQRPDSPILSNAAEQQK